MMWFDAMDAAMGQRNAKWTEAHVDELEVAIQRQYNPRLLVEALTELVRDEHETYHEGSIGDCEAPLCRSFFSIVARLSA